MNEYKRSCPKCGKETVYLNRKGFKYANDNNLFCKECRKQETIARRQEFDKRRWYRKCPKCQSEMEYKTHCYYVFADKNKKVCLKCSFTDEKKKATSERTKKRWADMDDIAYANECKKQRDGWTEEARNKLCHAQKIRWGDSDIRKRKSESYKGKNNPFYGKHHSQETIDKINKAVKNNIEYQTYLKSDEYRNQQRKQCTGSGNPMYGKIFYDVWVNKYGKAEADRRMVELKKKHSNNNKGIKCHFYGKPPPVGCGNGWSGWYKGWYFRSLRELTYMIHVIEKSNYKWITAESRDLAIKYKNENGVEKTYFSDFLVENKWLVEIKPEKLMGIKVNVLKKQAAEIFCKERNYEYRMVDIKILPIDELICLYKNKSIKLVDKYKNKLEKILCKLDKKKE